ncbi:sensor histidine kinase [Chloroflexus sp.]|uniref:sensor histidine kinase n=1 Tax=Chloroflexus sp. TaxID=1904827 RepID=UPI003D12007B
MVARNIVPARTAVATPDESLVADLLPPMLVLLATLAGAALGILLLNRWDGNGWAYAIILLLILATATSDRLRRHGQLQRASITIVTATTLLPILSCAAFGFTDNNFVYLSVLGVFAAGIMVSSRAPYQATQAAILLYIILLLAADIIGQPRPTWFSAIGEILFLVILLLSAATLSWAAAYVVRGTISWAINTAQKSERREQLLRETQATLERALLERDLLNEQLYRTTLELEEARAAAEAAYRSKSNFMATMSHELRTPLNIIIGFSTAMIEHPEMYGDVKIDEQILQDIAEIRRSGQHLLGLINDILDLAKIEAGKLELNRTNLALPPLLDETIRTAQALVGDRPIQLRREYHNSLPTVFADEVRIRQVLLNLVSNACKFTHMGEIAVGARAETDQVVLWVRDTGIGIAPADQERIFQQFEQVENADTRHHAGTGLGLSICRWLVELHGGRMWLESEVGKGSIFFFSLPCIRSSPHGSRITSDESR